jgi:arylsulfatase A-like enzyme
MNGAASRAASRVDRTLVGIAVVLGCGGGLIEGVVHMGLHRLNVLENVWYPIIWIAAIFNGLAVCALALALAIGLRLLPPSRRARMAAVFLIAFAALLPPIAWALKEWIHSLSIAVLVLAAAAGLTRWIGRDEEAAGRRFRRAVPWTLAATCLALAGIEGYARAAERIGTSRLVAAERATPNVLLVVVDALRSDHLSSYGYSRPSSPAIDRLAAGGALFEQAFATSSYTLPAHASIVTGLYPNQHGVEWGSSHRWAEHATIGEQLQARGYRTGAFSGNTYWFSREHGFGRGFHHFEDFFHSFADMALRTAYGRLISRKVLWRLGYDDIPARKHADVTNAAVLRWIARDRARPFFVMINYMDVHDPYLPPQPYRNRFATQPNPGGLINWELHIPETLTPAQLQSEIDAYDGSIAYVDDQLDALIAAIRERAGDRELMVVVTSDHGEEFGEHGGFLHGGHLYREAIRVPLIVSLPGKVPAGARIGRPVTNAAIPATILDLLGAAPATGQQPSLRPLWTSPQAASDWPPPLAELRRRPWEAYRALVRSGAMRSLVSPVLHFLEHETLGVELYDWVRDPREAVDLAKQPEMQPVIERFKTRLPDGNRTTRPEAAARR